MKLFVFICFVAICNATFGSKLNATVELAIFCDREFSEHFQHNGTRIREYWVTRMFDVDLKFKTLRSVDIQFVVTSITISKGTSDQPFVEESRDGRGQVAIAILLEKFSEWLTKSQDNMNESFDVALLAIGAETNSGTSGKGYVGGACNTNYKNHKAGTGIVRLVKDKWWNNCNNLDIVLSFTLGAFSATKQYSDECKSANYIKPGQCDENNYFFPSCADSDISEFVRNASCLHTVDVKNRTMFSKKELSMRPPSIQEQCAIQIKSSMAWVNQSDDKQCRVTNCYLQSEDGTLVVAQKLYPFDNSPCDNNKSCFRGECIPNGFLIQNVATSKCLHSTNRFSSNDSVSLVHCPEISNPMDRFIVTTTSGQTVTLKTPYSMENATENSEKCLTYNSVVDQIFYEKCSQESHSITTWFDWELISLENEQNEFIIRNKMCMQCVSVAEDHSKLVMSLCDKSNSLSVWKFDTALKIPQDIFLKYSNVFPTTTTTTNVPVRSKPITSIATRLSLSICHSFTLISVIMGYGLVYTCSGSDY